MAFLDQELKNFSFKGWLSLLGTGNRDTAPDNFAWYEEFTTNDLITKPDQVWAEYASIPEAKDLPTAVANSIANPTLIVYHGTASAVRLTPSINSKTFFATSVYSDMTTRMRNWIMPQLIPRTDPGRVGYPSVGYMVRIYNGDPGAGGVEIPTTLDQVGAITGWFMNFGTGAITVASSFTGVIDPTNVWMTGFQYIGKTLTDFLTSIIDLLRTNIQITGYTIANTVIDLTANGATWTKAEDNGDLGLNAGVFNTSNKIRVMRNGVEIEKAVDVIYDSATTFHITDNLYPGEVLYVYMDI